MHKTVVVAGAVIGSIGLALGLSACVATPSSSAASKPNTTSQSAPAAQPAPATDLNPCALVTASDLAPLLKTSAGSLQGQQGSDGVAMKCAYTNLPSGASDFVVISVTPSFAPGDFDNIVNDAIGNIKLQGMSVESTESVSGVGDRAEAIVGLSTAGGGAAHMYSVYAVKGTDLIYLNASDIPGFSESALVTLARSAVSRLP